MGQYQSGKIRLTNASAIVYGSWTANSISVHSISDGEALTFAPSGASGMAVSFAGGVLTFFITSVALPAAGDTASASGGRTWPLTSIQSVTAWLTSPNPALNTSKDLLTVVGDGRTFQLAVIDANHKLTILGAGPDWTTGTYDYSIHREFTATQGLSLIQAGDKNLPQLWTRDHLLIEAALAAAGAIVPGGWTALPTMTSPWVNVGSPTVAGYTKDPFGWLRFRGSIGVNTGTVNKGAAICTMPVLNRPSQKVRISVGLEAIHITTSGVMTFEGADGFNGFINLDSLQYRAEQ